MSDIYNIVNLKRNIVLIGLPGSGKSTIGKKLSKQLDMNLLEVDDLITETRRYSREGGPMDDSELKTSRSSSI